jgi:hypothetical protein
VRVRAGNEAHSVRVEALGLEHRQAILEGLPDIAAGDVGEAAGRIAEEIGQDLVVGELIVRRQGRVSLRLSLDLLDFGEALAAVAGILPRPR